MKTDFRGFFGEQQDGPGLSQHGGAGIISDGIIKAKMERGLR
jgi:hypothetical protein